MYTSPLHILSGKNLSEINDVNLKKWRKELLLRFELENSTTINIAGREYDKNEVLSAVETLKNVSNFHFEIFKDKPLLAFLEMGDVTFFNDYKKWSFLRNEELTQQIKPYFTYHYSRIISKSIQTSHRNSVLALKSVLRSGFPMPDSYKDEAFAAAHTSLSTIIMRAKVEMRKPFQPGGGFSLKKEAYELFHLNYIQILGMLPNSFSDLKTSYAILANNFVYEALQQSTKHSKLPKKTLKTLVDASKINQHFRPNQQTVRLIRQLQDMLVNAHSSNDTSGALQGILLIVGIFVFIFRVISLGSDVNRSQNKKYNQYNSNQYNYRPKTKSIDPRKQNKPVDKDELLGKWTSMTWLEGSSNVQQTIDFFDGSVGRMSFSVFEIDSTYHPDSNPNKSVDIAGKKVICTCHSYFIYKVKNGIYSNAIQFENKGLDWKNCDDAPLRNTAKTALTAIKTKLSNQYFAQRIYFQNRKNQFALDVFWFEKKNNVAKNWKKELQQKAPELFAYVSQKSKLTTINDAIATKFVKGTKATNLNKMPKFFVSPDDMSLIFKGRVTEIPMADGQFIKGKYYIQPNLWVSPDTTIFSIGQFKNIDYLDKNGKKKRGDLKIFQTTEEGFLFGLLK